MEEQNQNSITPLVSGSLAKANSSIGVTQKILSESIHEFYGDFEGKKISEIKAGYNEWGNMYQLFLCDKTLIFCQDREAIKLYKEESHSLENFISYELLFDKDDRELEVYSPAATSFILMIKEKYLVGCDCFLLALVNSTLFKISLPSFNVTAKKQFTKDITGYNNGVNDTWTVTPDNKYIIRVIEGDYRSNYTRNIVQLWDSKILKIVSSFEIPNSQNSNPTLISESNLFLSITQEGLSLWNYLNGVKVKDFHIPNIGIYTKEYKIFSGTRKVVDYNAKNGLFACILLDGSCIQLYQLETGSYIRGFELSSYTDYKYTNLRFSNNGNYLLAWCYNIVHLYDTKSLNLITSYSDFYYHEGDVEYGEPNVGAIDSFFGFTDKHIYTLDGEGTIHKWK